MIDETNGANGNGEAEGPLEDLLAPEGGAEPAPANPLAEQVAALEKERDDLNDRIMRALAETENVRKRSGRQVEDARAYAIEKFARDLLNVSDSLTRAVDSLPDGMRAMLPDGARAMIEGVELTQKELVAVLSRNGVTPIDASPGTAFDPALHQAVTQIPSPHPPGTVAELFQTGWRIGDRTLRAAMVAVSAG